MIRTQIYLTEEEHHALRALSAETGKSQSEWIREAIDQLVVQYKKPDRKKLLQQARGMWKDRADLFDLETLRQEWERF
jgi:hypothetical protein